MKWIVRIGYGVVLLLLICVLVLMLITLHDMYIRPMYPDIVQAEPVKLSQFQEIVGIYLNDREYNRTRFNCVNFSTDIKQIADIMGVPAQMVVGCSNESNETKCHQWLRLWVDYEPQYNKVVDYSEKYPELRVIE